MLDCNYIASNYPGGKKKTRGFFAQFPRLVSDRVTHEIIKRLGFSNSCRFVGDGTDVPDLYATFLALPELDPSTSSFELIQAHALFQKNGDMRSPINKEQVAWEKFLLAEKRCSEFNSLFSSRKLDSVTCSILHYAKLFIADALGKCPEYKDLKYAFGPGASVTDVDSKITSPQWKLAGTPTISNSLIPLVEELRALFPGWLGLRNIVPVAGKLEFVPKSFKTHRSILVEPLINAFMQKGVGSYMKKILLRSGIDLCDQSVQRRRARQGSIDGSFATIDLSMASDTICYMLVMELLPWDWFCLLDRLRTPLARYKGKLVVLEKFSSMGNGYTFELESLIFKSIVHGIAKTFSVDDDSVCYGDDITCHAALGALVEKHLPLFGFTVNKEKSFLTGPFREACGGDYRDGVDIRPFFLKSLRDGGRWSVAKLVSFHNFLLRKKWFDVNELRDLTISLINTDLRKWGPPGYGDGHLHSGADVSTYLERIDNRKGKKRRRQDYEGYRCESFIAVPCESEGPRTSDVYNLASYISYAGLSSDGPYNLNAHRAPQGALIVSQVAVITVAAGGQSTKVDWNSLAKVARRRKGLRHLSLSLKSL